MLTLGLCGFHGKHFVQVLHSLLVSEANILLIEGDILETEREPFLVDEVEGGLLLADKVVGRLTLTNEIQRENFTG